MAPNFTEYGSDSYAAAIGFHPSLGMNGVYVGGAFQFGAFRGQGRSCSHNPARSDHVWGEPDPRGNPRASGGNFYVQRATDVRTPDQLLTFASARGGDVEQGGYWSWGQTLPNPLTPAHPIRPGYFIVTPPKPHPYERGDGVGEAFTLAGGWNASNTFNRREVPSTWGMIDGRYSSGKAVTVQFDGSVRMQGLSDLRDMRKWTNLATNPDWSFPTSQAGITWP